MAANLSLFFAYIRANIATALEYRTTLITQVFGMFVNDILWVIFWTLFFKKFPILKGWTLNDVLTLWAVITVSYGSAAGIFGNAVRIPFIIINGQLDYYLALPKNVLFHMLISQMRLVNLGDLIFGPLLLFFIDGITPTKVFLYICVAFFSSVVTLSFLILVGSLAFFLGNSETLNNQLIHALINFSTYPGTIFEGRIKILLYTVLPAGFVTTLPVEIIRNFEWIPFGQLFLASLAFFLVSVSTFHLGLRRYESGNLMRMLG